MKTKKRNKKKTERPEEILPGRLYTTVETMLYLDVKRDAFRGIMKEVPHTFVGRRRRFKGEDILRYLEKNGTAGVEKAKPKKEVKARQKPKLDATELSIANLNRRGFKIPQGEGT